jgi:ATP/maltotriose-dependent transcriptional regulator MalT
LAVEANELSLLSTKLYRPHIGQDIVPRTWLVEQIDRHRDQPLTLVVAPVGYGKTTSSVLSP